MPDLLQTRAYGPESAISPHAGSHIEPTPGLEELGPPLGARTPPARPDARAWSRERDEALIVMWSDHLSAAEIGRRLGISKNAVIGRSHRLRLPSRPSPIIRKGEVPKPGRAQTAAPPCLPEPVARPVAAAAVSLRTPSPEPQERVRSSCRWPIGHPRTAEFAFCGEPCSAGKPYCAEHCRRAYVRRPIVCTAETAA